MGVKGLWKLIEPVGRPINLETMEGKALAIDSSIWIYQFQATMRDKEGRGLVNAHVLGFLRRICKLLFYGIKPVFVFDGGAPPLKRATISERKRKKVGAAASHAQIAERLLAAQMRRQAVTDAEQRSRVQDPRRAPKGPVVVGDDTVYLEDLDNPQPAPSPKASAATPQESPPSASKRKNKWIDYDPYRLPEVDDNALLRAISSTVPDPRLATEEELRQFIQEMKPSEFDIASPEFRALPTEVQYEIIGDLRLKSRQTSYGRLNSMLRNSKTPMDFSMAQIKGLKQRNRLTQRLLTTTDSIGKAHIEIPIRIASERNREYVLVKNTGEEGGWVLGIRDTGTEGNPIQIDQDPILETRNFVPSDSDDEEVGGTLADQIPAPLSLSSIGQRRPSGSTVNPKQPSSKADGVPLFVPEPGEIEYNDGEGEEIDLQIAIQESLEEQEASQLRSAMELSKAEMTGSMQTPSTSGASSSRQFSYNHHDQTRIANDDSAYVPLHKVPSRLGSVLTFANTTPKQSHWPRSIELNPPSVSSNSLTFGKPVLLTQATTPTKSSRKATPLAISDSEDSMEEVEIIAPSSVEPLASSGGNGLLSTIDHDPSSSLALGSEGEEEDDDDMELIETVQPIESELVDEKDVEVEVSGGFETHSTTISSMQTEGRQKETHGTTSNTDHEEDESPPAPVNTSATLHVEAHLPDRNPSPPVATAFLPSNPRPTASKDITSTMEDTESEVDEWDTTREETGDAQSQARADVDWDAAQEINAEEEAGEFANFASQVKGRDLAVVRKEIDEEIRALHQQRKAAMRDSEDITQQMVSQIMIMLRLFGIPYITAPMEAEAQCAELVQLGLVEGIITDDSDVFLFGGTRVLKNLFNQSQTVEVFLASDLSRELELERDKLIRLAYLLGSDYVEGLPGVGPVIAMELIREFPGDGGLLGFREWWRRVQSGQDKSVVLSAFKRRFKKRFKDLFLPSEWPNPVVRDAYIHPTVDSSDEPFKWGIPDLDGLREFFRNELSWNKEKVDELLIPIIRKMNQRSQANAMNKQGLLDPFLEKGSAGIISAPRKRDGYASKRLQQVVADFRKQKARQESNSEDPEGGEVQPEQNKKKGKKAAPKRKREKKALSRGQKRAARALSASSEEEREDARADEMQSQAIPDAPLSVRLRPRPKPKRPKPTIESDAEVEETNESMDQ